MVSDMSFREALREAEGRLGAAGCPSPRVDAELLLAHALRSSRTALYAEGERELAAADEATFEQLLARREAREPLAYVLGEWGFRRLTLMVDRRVLVPRPETEIVVERCLALLRDLAEPTVLDVGVGSGAIALAIAEEHPGARVTGIDRSPGALAVARANAEALGLADRVELFPGDAADGLGDGVWDLVVSNPPYVNPAQIDALEPEVRDWEPREALVGPGVTEMISASAFHALRPGGYVVLEVDDGAAARVRELLATTGYDRLALTRDLAGRERVVEGRRPL
jgi:release factor glutamine methyltransferase